MDCFTVINDRNPYPGITLSSTSTGLMVGIKGNFCHIADGFNYGREPQYVMTSDPCQRVHIPETGLWAVIYGAGVTNKLGVAEPLLCYPEDDELPQVILVYWAVDQSLDGQVKTCLSDKRAFRYFETMDHPPYFEGLYVLAEGGYVEAHVNHSFVKLQNVGGLPTVKNFR